MAFSPFWNGVVIDAVNQALKPIKKILTSQGAENFHRTYMAILQAGASRVDIAPEEVNKNFYLQKWNKPSYALIAKMRTQLNADHILLDMYFRFLRMYAVKGVIPWEKYDPVGFSATKQLQKKFPTERNIFESASETAAEVGKKTIGMIPWIVLGAAGIAAYVLTSNFKKSVS